MVEKDIDECDDTDYNEMAEGLRLNAQYFARLSTSPDCRDPDHPGCPDCWDEDTRIDLDED